MATPQFNPHPDAIRTAKFDWFNVVGNGNSREALAVVREWFGDTEKGHTGGKGYRERHYTEQNRAIFFDKNVRNEDRWMVGITGTGISYLDEAIKGPVCALLGQGAQLSQFHAAIDVKDLKGDTVPQLKTLAAHLGGTGLVKPSGTALRGTGSNTGAFTEYFGSRKSDRFIRAYDKSAEQQEGSDWWFRWEAVIGGKFARLATPQFTPEADWARLARGQAASASELLEKLRPDLWLFLFEGDLAATPMETRRTMWDGFCSNADRAVFQKVAMLSEATGIPRIDILTEMGFLTSTPSERQSSHSGIISELQCLLSERRVNTP